MAGSLLTQVETGISASLSGSPVDAMPNRDSPPAGSFIVSISPDSRNQWAWLDALGRSLDCSFVLVDAQGAPALIIGATYAAEILRSSVTRADSSLPALVADALASDTVHQAILAGLDVVARRLSVDGQ